ncbi:hypothetical protein CYLTODRAFT_455957 [Cylindrobasidium torrendii FP15055 ss-10]|uniref:F-box domain-containing protein n=1 Tax=Cylindrobasidium torrendii FP15055 ss-10 TaxID=1314674 RepID=A0A0D7B5P2_9AGAR|nr:hypothetical protein CYLTODRAFT_455957 [Cylindrobasidium torrendii FP15055 ss-10]
MPPFPLPQELIDTIVSELRCDEYALRAASTVSKRWTHPSQRILFARISLSPSKHYFKGTQADLLIRLHNLLASAPHIGPYIRRLEVDPSQDIPPDFQYNLALLSRLDEVRIVDFAAAPISSLEHRAAVGELLSRPGIRHLFIGAGAWYFGDVLPCLQAAPHITELALNDVIFEGYQAVASLTDTPRCSLRLQKLEVERGFHGLLEEFSSTPGVDLRELKELRVFLGVRNAQMALRCRNMYPVVAIENVLRGTKDLERLALDIYLSGAFYPTLRSSTS